MIKSFSERDSQEYLKKLAALVVVIILTGFLIYASVPYFGGVFSALVLFTLFRPFQNFIIRKWSISEAKGAIVTMLVSFFVILIPSVLSIVVIGSTLSDSFSALQGLNSTNLDSLINKDLKFFGINILESFVNYTNLESIISTTASFAQQLILDTIASISNFALQLVIAYFILYFLLVERSSLEKFVYSMSPFKRSNTTRLLSEFHNQAFANIVGAGINAFIQGGVFAFGLWFVGVDNAVFWGFVGAILSFLPVVGMPLIWLPIVIYFISKGQYFDAVLLSIWGGVVITLLDNSLRLIINKKIGNIHPIITLMGVLIGLPLFGILGLVVGPLILSYFVLILSMYKEEYISE